MGYTWSTVSAEEAVRLINMNAEERQRFVEEYRITLSSLDRRLRDLRSRFGLAVQDRNTRKFDDYLVLDTNNAIIISDTEFPDTDMNWMQRAYDVAKANSIETLIWAGDVFAFDQAKVNRHDTRHETSSMTMAQIVDYVKDVQSWLSHQFNRQYVIGSNHDDRFNIALGGGLNVGHLLPDVQYTPYDYMYVRTSHHGVVKIVHPDSYSTAPVTMMQRFYNAEQGPDYDPTKPYDTLTKTHFVCAHTHITSFNYSADGAHKLISIGTMRSPRKTQYYSHSQTGLPRWTNSFAAIINGSLQLITE